MQRSQETRPRAKSPFVAAFLSLLFPGLGHVYAGAYQRALGFAAPVILVGALTAGVLVRMPLTELASIVLTPGVLLGVFLVNLALLIYRLVAIVDAYRVTVWLNAQAVSGGGRLGRPRLAFQPISIAGLVAVILVMSGVHVVVARYDLIAQGVLTDPCVFLTDTSPDSCDQTAGPSGSDNGPTDGPGDSPSPTPSQPPIQGSALPDVTIPPWNGTERLNILLVGVDQRPQEGTFNTDTLIVVSIDPVTKQVAMFSLPRDSWGVPLPPGRLGQAFGPTYQAKINSLFTAVRGRPDLVPGKTPTLRGMNGLKEVLGNLYNLDIKYFVEVNFQGFEKVVDDLGGVTINVQVPVLDDLYPADTGRHARVYIPAGIQHMTGAQALIYARSRHASDDFDRGARQQRVLTSLREQANVATLIPRIPELIDDVGKLASTDISQADLAKLAGLAGSVDTKNIRSYVFAYPRYGTQVQAPIYKYLPDVSKIQAAVANAFKVDPNLENTRASLADENGQIWVLNGSGIDGQGSDLAGYLAYYGLAASAPTTRPDMTGVTGTQIVVYNGAESRLSQTIAFLESKFRTKVILRNDPTVPVDVVITTTSQTPRLAAPASN
jgi:LCP family protein required for cell wall assembly